MKILNLTSLIPIKVHVWGGLGSQLFACVVGRRLKHYFPTRQIQIYFHSSGVTKRNLEVPKKLLQGFVIVIVDDFTNASKHDLLKKRLVFSNIRSKVKSLLLKLGLISELNNQLDFESLSKRLVEVRGHYSQIKLKQDEISWLFESLVSPNDRSKFGSKASLHYRLGDLLTLEGKGPVEKDRIIEEIYRLSDVRELLISSDSPPEKINQLLRKLDSGILTIYLNGSTADVISACFHSLVFIGTNSKISYWIAIFRLSLQKEGITRMPTESITYLNLVLPQSPDAKRLLAY
jgi:hypothetical protein